MRIKYLNRALSSTIEAALKTFPAVVITGPRQTGKTTLLKEEYGSRFKHASLEDPDVRAVALSDPRGFLKSHAPPCIFEEVQHAPDLLSFVKTAIDEQRSPGQWILTGSQSFPLMARVSQSLAGQASILQLHGLSSVEIPPDLRMETPLELLRGSFPEPRLRLEVDLRLWMGGYLQTYLERDVRQLTQVGDLVSFEGFLRLCAARTAQLLRVDELARDAAVSATTARAAWVERSAFFAILISSPISWTAAPFFLHGELERGAVLEPPVSSRKPARAWISAAFQLMAISLVR